MEGGRSSELMRSHVFEMKPTYLALCASFESQQLPALSISVHVDESGHGFRFECSGRPSEDFQAMSAVAERPREETLDDLS